jgi:hypothetical protein
MSVMKYVDGVNVEMTPEEEAEFLATLPDPIALIPTTSIITISDRQFFQQLAIDGFISQQDALDAVMTGVIPPLLAGFINNIEDPSANFNARMLMSGATEFQRNHPMVSMIADYMALPPEAVDDFFQRASAL